MAQHSLNETLHQLMHTYTDLLHEGIKQQKIALSVIHIRTLKGVFYDPNSTAKSISAFMRRDKAQITRALNDLLAADLIVKKDNPKDGRSQLLELTTQGKAVIAKLESVEDWAKKELTKHISQTDLEQFLQVSRLMITNVKNDRDLG